ncbi:MAG: hypothetical protein QXH91_08695, partial [Candidatus Bathyarchaeia archaeon]
MLTLLIGYLVGEEDQESQIRKRGGSINYNGSRRIPHYSWARVDYTIINEQKRNIETKIRMSPLNQRNITIYDIIFSVPGLRKMLFGNLVTIGSVNNYAVDLFVDGQQMTNANERLNNIRLGHPLDHYLLFLNDDPDIGYGN